MTTKTCSACGKDFESTETGRIFVDRKTPDGFKRAWYCPDCSKKMKLVKKEG